MRLLIECFNTGSPKWLLFNPDEDFNFSELTKAFEKIIEEYEQAKNTHEYKNHIEKQESKIYRQFQYLALNIALQNVLTKNIDNAKQIIEAYAFGIEPEEKAIMHLIKSYENIFKLENINEQKQEKEPANWAAMMVFIHQVTGLQIDYNCTVELYLEYEKTANQIIAQRKKANA